MSSIPTRSMTAADYASGLGVETRVEVSFVPKSAPAWVLVAAAFTVLGAGSFDSIASKWMNKQDVPTCSDCEAVLFNGPFVQTLLMYIGETLCLAVYLIDELFTSHKGKQRTFDFPTSAQSINKPPSPIWWWFFPMFMDFAGSSMINYALVITFASTVQMLRNFNIVLTALLTVFWMRRALLVRHWSGVVLVTIGMVITGVYGIVNPEEGTDYDSSLAWVGIVLAIAGTCLNALQYVTEEALLRKYYMSPLKAVGVEGGFGLIVTAITLIIVEFGGFEDVKGSFYQIFNSGILLTASLLYIVCITLFNAGGLMVTKLGSGLMRAVIVAARTVTIWILELCLGWNTFDWLNFSGLIVITLGCLLYNRVYPTSCCPKFGAALDKPVPCCGLVEIPSSDPLPEIDLEGRELSVDIAIQERESSNDSDRTSLISTLKQ